MTRMHGGWPWMASLDNAFVQAAGRAIERGFGKAPVFTREGGSIPVVATFQRVLGIPSVLFGVGLPDDRIHAPNEKLDLANFYNGIIASAFLYDEFAAVRAPASERLAQMFMETAVTASRRCARQSSRRAPSAPLHPPRYRSRAGHVVDEHRAADLGPRWPVQRAEPARSREPLAKPRELPDSSRTKRRTPAPSASLPDNRSRARAARRHPTTRESRDRRTGRCRFATPSGDGLPGAA